MKKLLLILAIVALAHAGLAWGGESHSMTEYYRILNLPIEQLDCENILSGCAETDMLCQQLRARCTEALNTVTAYKASDGTLFETRGAMEKHEINLERLKHWTVIYNKIFLGRMMSEEDAYAATDVLIGLWPEIKAIMEGEK